jgi:glutathione S-transferase
MMIIRTSLTSPFGRKARMGAAHLGLKVEVRPTVANEPGSTLADDNPLGKMPVLIREDGRRVYDSRVILEQFDILAGGGRLIPVEPDARIDALTLQALGDGIMDAGILVVYEGRFRPKEMHHAPWVEYQRAKLRRGLAALAKNPPDPAKVTVGTISVACALGYVDWRKQSDWRKDHPTLVGWLEAFRAASPAFDATLPPEE